MKVEKEYIIAWWGDKAVHLYDIVSLDDKNIPDEVLDLYRRTINTVEMRNRMFECLDRIKTFIFCVAVGNPLEFRVCEIRQDYRELSKAWKNVIVNYLGFKWYEEVAE